MDSVLIKHRTYIFRGSPSWRPKIGGVLNSCSVTVLPAINPDVLVKTKIKPERESADTRHRASHDICATAELLVNINTGC